MKKMKFTDDFCEVDFYDNLSVNFSRILVFQTCETDLCFRVDLFFCKNSNSYKIDHSMKPPMSKKHGYHFK